MKKVIVLLVMFHISIFMLPNSYGKEVMIKPKGKSISGQQLSMEDKLYGLSNLWYDIKNIEGINQIPINVDSLHYVFIGRMLTTKNDAEYYRHLTFFLGPFFYQYPDIFTEKKQAIRKKYIPDAEWNFNYAVDIKKVI